MALVLLGLILAVMRVFKNSQPSYAWVAISSLYFPLKFRNPEKWKDELKKWKMLVEKSLRKYPLQKATRGDSDSSTNYM